MEAGHEASVLAPEFFCDFMAPKKEEASRQLSMIFNHTRFSPKIGSLAGSKERFPLVQVSSLWPCVTPWRRHGAFQSQ